MWENWWRTGASALLMAGAGLIGLAGIHVSPVLARTAPGRRIFPALVETGAPDAVALTFDDGPDQELERFLALLRDHDATATFFMTGEQVRLWPDAPRRVVEAGHEVGLHGDRHRPHLLLTPWQVAADLRRGRATLEDALGAPVSLFRPPYGLFSLASWVATQRQGLAPVLWARSGHDWGEHRSPESIVAAVGEPRAGEIVLLHCSDRYRTPGSSEITLAALPALIERCHSRGLRLRSIAGCLALRQRIGA